MLKLEWYIKKSDLKNYEFPEVFTRDGRGTVKAISIMIIPKITAITVFILNTGHIYTVTNRTTPMRANISTNTANGLVNRLVRLMLVLLTLVV